jgi:glycosyltransferase involved in cell wall biosynthesis
MQQTCSILASFLQLPQEATSGAARSMRTVCEFLAMAGWNVEVLGTTATEGRLRIDAHAWLSSCGIELQSRAGPQSSQILCFSHRKVNYRLLDIGLADAATSRQVSGDAFDELFDETCRRHRPDVFLTYGGWVAELDRRARARRNGTRVVFSLHNEAYVRRAAFDSTDGALCSSNYLAGLCRERLGVSVPVLPLPIDATEVVAPVREPAFATFINPELCKGAAAFARIAEEVSLRRPKIPFLVVNSRQQSDLLSEVGRLGGFDLRRHSNIFVAEPVVRPANIYAVTRVLLVPSLQEAAGRVAAEALLNGIPPIVSNRGGLPGVVGAGGFVLPLHEAISVHNPHPPTADAVGEWVDLTIRLMTEDAPYQEASERARRAGRVYEAGALVKAYDEYFRSVLAGRTPAA